MLYCSMKGDFLRRGRLPVYGVLQISINKKPKHRKRKVLERVLVRRAIEEEDDEDDDYNCVCEVYVITHCETS
jgi:hypothetical protein